MCLTPACLRSPLMLSRHGTWCIPHRWRHADWPSIGHTPPYGSWHRYPRPESADGKYAWLDPAEQVQVGRQQPKRKERARRSRAYTRGNYSQKNPPESDVAVSNSRGVSISDANHVSPKRHLRTARAVFCQKNGHKSMPAGGPRPSHFEIWEIADLTQRETGQALNGLSAQTGLGPPVTPQAVPCTLECS